MSLRAMDKYCVIDVNPAEIRMLWTASRDLPALTFPTKKQRNEKGNKMLYSKSKKVENAGRELLNSPADTHFENFVQEIESYYTVQEDVSRFDVDNTNMRLYKHDPTIIVKILSRLLVSGDLNDGDPQTYHGTLRNQYIFRIEVEEFLNDMKEVERALKAPRIHKMGWA